MATRFGIGGRAVYRRELLRYTPRVTTPVDADRFVSVVIPVYNTPDLDALVERIERAFADRPEKFEIILVDDSSPDARVWPAIERIARERYTVRGVQLSRNFGQQAATLCGLSEARGEVVITMDDDLQHDPEDIGTLLAHAHHDIVIGQFERREHHLFRRLASSVKARFDEIVIGKPRGLRLTSFRLISRTVVDGVLAIRTPNPFLPALMFHISKDVAGVTVKHGPRASGRSGYTLRKLLRLFSNLVINNSSILLRTVAWSGMIFALISVTLAALVIYRKLFSGVAVQGWASLFAAVMLIGGLILISIGIVGEYLIRIIESSEARPTYFVRRRASR
jgi:dolichol-phosphate mannosyltransferase/undecaprenyl-phosphate 4-deoxy-4-formamido-L-arabinose transferase